MHLKFTQSYDKNVRAGMATECTQTHTEEFSYRKLLSVVPTEAVTEVSHPNYNWDVILYICSICTQTAVVYPPIYLHKPTNINS